VGSCGRKSARRDRGLVVKLRKNEGLFERLRFLRSGDSIFYGQSRELFRGIPSRRRIET
jgi:hypothetical protein